MEKIDIKMKLLLADSFDVHGIEIKPLTLGEICRIGYTRYSQLLSLLNFKLESPERQEAVSIIDIAMSDEGGEIQKEFVNALRLFLRVDKIIVNDRYGAIFLNEMPTNLEDAQIIRRDTYKDIIRVINLQNTIISIDDFEDEVKPSKSKMAQYIKDKIKKGNEIRKKIQGKDQESDADFVDILSAVSAKSNSINKLNIVDLTLYQLNDEFNRLRMIDQFNITIQSMMAGATEAEVVHWSEKMKK